MPVSLPQALYVFAHPEPRSFNRTLFDVARAELELTHAVETSDLYALGFDPLLTSADFPEHRDAPGSFIERWGAATAANALAPEVLREQRKLREAELIVFQFPLWWYAPPAILKGWIDRVFSAGFGFDVRDPATGRTRKYGDGLLTNKRALVVTSFGETSAALGQRGIAGDIDSLLFPFTHGTLFYTGIEPLPLHIIPDADDLTAELAAAEVARLRQRIAGLGTETPIPYRTQAGGDYHPGRVLREDAAPGRVDLGIHLRA